MYRWSLYTGGPCIQVVLVYRWYLYTGGPWIQVVLVYRWYLCTGGPCIQVVLVYRWYLCTGGPWIQVVLGYRWSLYTGGLCVQFVLNCIQAVFKASFTLLHNRCNNVHKVCHCIYQCARHEGGDILLKQHPHARRYPAQMPVCSIPT